MVHLPLGFTFGEQKLDLQLLNLLLAALASACQFWVSLTRCAEARQLLLRPLLAPCSVLDAPFLLQLPRRLFFWKVDWRRNVLVPWPSCFFQLLRLSVHCA